MLILAAILGILIYGIVAATWGTFNPTLGFTNAQIGTLSMAQSIGLVVASISVGPLIDLKGKKIALVGGLAMISISFWMLPAAGGNFTLVLLALVLLGLGGGIVVTGANTLVSDVSESRRGSMLNILNLFFGLGGFVTPFVTANILGGSAVRMCYLAAVLATVALLVNVITPMPKPTGERGFKASEIGSVVGRPALYMLALFLFLYIACEVGVWNWLARYLIEVRKLDKTTALNILALGFALGLLVGRLAISRVLINVSALSVTLGASVAMAITTFAMLQVTSPSAAWVVVFCAGMAMAPIFPTTLALVGDAFPRMSATAMGIVITCGWLGLTFSSPIIGHFALGTALLLLPGFSVIMILVNLALRPLLRKPA
ncbi:MAG: MFS transporter [Bryobacteraceae bacterium]|jgi:fucose permease